MTREEAIAIIQELWRYKETDKYTESEIRQALQIALKALEQEPKTYAEKPVKIGREENNDAER